MINLFLFLLLFGVVLIIESVIIAIIKRIGKVPQNPNKARAIFSIALTAVSLFVCLAIGTSQSNNEAVQPIEDAAIEYDEEESSHIEDEIEDLATEDTESEYIEPEESVPREPEETSTYDGSGDSIIQLEERQRSWVLYISGNASAKHFAVKGYDANNNATELFVNTTEPYNGITFDITLETKTLEISATGDWHIEQRDIATLDILNDNAPYNGNGDTILIYRGSGSTATISGNNGAHHFAVKSFGNSGDNLMVNTVDHYNGQVMLKYEPLLIQVTAIGDWTITTE